MPTRVRRHGVTTTFSVSVDAETKRALRALAEESFDGNVSAAVADLAEEARRRVAAGRYLDAHAIAKPTSARVVAIEEELAREIRETRRRRKGRRVA